MPRYLIEASYTLEGVKGVQRSGGTSRRDAIAALAESEVAGSRASTSRLVTMTSTSSSTFRTTRAPQPLLSPSTRPAE